MHFQELMTSSGEQVLGTTAAFSEAPTMPRRQEEHSAHQQAEPLQGHYGDNPTTGTGQGGTGFRAPCGALAPGHPGFRVANTLPLMSGAGEVQQWRLQPLPPEVLPSSQNQ